MMRGKGGQVSWEERRGKKGISASEESGGLAIVQRPSNV